MDTVQSHIETICKTAGLEVMAQVFEIIRERETSDEAVTAAALLALTPADVADYYEGWLAPAIDRIEIGILPDPVDPAQPIAGTPHVG